jgi:hypothetical protein
VGGTFPGDRLHAEGAVARGSSLRGRLYDKVRPATTVTGVGSSMIPGCSNHMLGTSSHHLLSDLASEPLSLNGRLCSSAPLAPPQALRLGSALRPLQSRLRAPRPLHWLATTAKAMVARRRERQQGGHGDAAVQPPTAFNATTTTTATATARPIKLRWRLLEALVGLLGRARGAGRPGYEYQTASAGGGGMDPRLLLATVTSAVQAQAATPKAISFNRRVTNLFNASIRKFIHAFDGPRRDTLILLLTTTIVVPLMTRLKTSPILGFLLTGCMLGPHGLSLVNDIKTTEALAELGIVFFLFEMGLELSVDRLIQMRRDVFGLGLSQFSITAVAISLVASWLGLPGGAAIVVGGALALSSSAFVLQLLRDKDDLGTRHGRASFGVLLFQVRDTPPRRVPMWMVHPRADVLWDELDVDH